MFPRLKTIVISVLLLGFSHSIWAKPVLIKAEHQIEEYQLANGLKVVLAPNAQENKVLMNTIYYTGSLNDPKGKGGLAHLLEHLAFKGTANVPGAEFQRRLNQYTLRSNATTDYHSTRYMNQIRPDAKSIDQVLMLEAERMDKLVLNEQLIPAEIDIVLREWEMRMDQPFMLFVDQMFRSAYGNDFLGRTPIGDLAEIKSIRLPELQAYYRDWYAPNNAVLVFSGQFDKKQLLKSIDRHFSPLTARHLPTYAATPTLNTPAIQQRNFTIAKGSNHSVQNVYLMGRNDEFTATMALAPYLHTFEPSGKLYKALVSNQQSSAVQSVSWLERDYQLLFLGAVHTPQQPAHTMAQLLNQQAESAILFNQRELQRAKMLLANQAESEQKNAVQFGNRLADFLVNHQGDWQKYFHHLDAVQALDLATLNQQLQVLIQPQHRLQGIFSPTPHTQTTTVQPVNTQQNKRDSAVTPAVLKDVSGYRKEVRQYLKDIGKISRKKEAKIERGIFDSGLQYAFYPTKTEDGHSYATLQLGFGDALSLKEQTEIIELTAFLLLRGTQKYQLEDIIDRGIESQGEASVSRVNNAMRIQISAKNTKFTDYFAFILELLRQPSFDAHEFDLIRQQTLDGLNRPYTEPTTVAQIRLAELIEHYPAGDLRYRLDPLWLKQQYTQANRQHVIDFYQKFMGTAAAQVSVTGEFDRDAIHALLQTQLADWLSPVPYQAVATEYVAQQAQRSHVKAEPREFGHYQAYLSFPVGEHHPDAAAVNVLKYILSESQLSSRLGLELRAKQGLIYGFYTRYQLNEGNNAGTWVMGANYRSGDAERISAAVRQVLAHLLQQGVTEQELAAAKADLLRKQLLALENERQVHQRLNSQLRQQVNLQHELQRAQHLAALSPADIHRVAVKYFDPAGLIEVMADQYGLEQTQLNSALGF